jgi:hypothetical protein
MTIGVATNWGKTLLALAFAIAAYYKFPGFDKKRAIMLLPTRNLAQCMMSKIQHYDISACSPGVGIHSHVTTVDAFSQNITLLVLCPARLLEFVGIDSSTCLIKATVNVEFVQSRLDILRSCDDCLVVYDEVHVLLSTAFVTSKILTTAVKRYLPSAQIVAMTGTTVCNEYDAMIEALCMSVSLMCGLFLIFHPCVLITFYIHMTERQHPPVYWALTKK